MSKFFYSVNDCGGRFDIKVTGRRNLSRERTFADLAEECAQDYHSNHDGWESTWPLVIALYETEDGPPVGQCVVDREAQPVFSASMVEFSSQSTTGSTP